MAEEPEADDVPEGNHEDRQDVINGTNDDNDGGNEDNDLDRASEIVEGRKRLEEMQRRIDILERDHEDQMVKNSITVDAAYIWERLNRRHRNDKSMIMLALQHSPTQPDGLSWDNFHHLPANVRWDKELFLARLQYVPGFEEAYMDYPFPIPSKFRNDKQIMIEICKRNSHSLSSASKTLKNDPDVVKAAITQRYHFAPMALQYASSKIRDNRRIARVALSQEYGIRAFQYLSAKLQEDPKLAILAIKKAGADYAKYNDHFRDLPELFREDEDVVFEAVRHRGSNLRYVSKSNGLLQDPDIVFEAVRQDGSMLEYVRDKSILDVYLQDEDDLMMILQNGGGQLLASAPKGLIGQQNFVMEAVQNGYIHSNLGKLYNYKTAPDSLPDEKTRTFFFNLLKTSNNIHELYEELPANIREQKDVMLAVLQNPTIDEYLVGELSRKKHAIPTTVSREEAKEGIHRVLLDIIRNGNIDHLKSSHFDEYMEDEEFAKKACALDGECLNYSILSDEIIIQALRCKENPVTHLTIKSLPSQFLTHNSVALSILVDSSFTDEEKLLVLYRLNYQRLASSKKLLLACINQGWLQRVVSRFSWNVLNVYKDDHEFVLATIRAYKKFGSSWRGYTYFADDIMDRHKTDRELIKEMIQIEPRLLFSSRITANRDDYEYMLQAVGSGREALQASSHQGAELAQLVCFAKQVRERLAGDGFFLFLQGVSLPAPPPSEPEPPKKRRRLTRSFTEKVNHCNLPLLNCGHETSIALKRLIGEYAGAPIGVEYKLLRAAFESLTFWGY